MTSENPDATPSRPSHEQQLEEALAHESGVVERLYARLDELREQTAAKLAEVRRDQTANTHQNRSERDAYAGMYEDRLAQLNAVDQRLVFGRLDLDDAATRYIGRIGLTDEQHQRLMVDWRAPEAGTFYQATAFDRQGVRRRRHLIMERRALRSIEDDVLDPEFLDQEQVLHGEGALLAALNRRRTGRMGDIVATIQAEQDRIIRSDLPGVRVVQGGPGSILDARSTGHVPLAVPRVAELGEVVDNHQVAFTERMARNGDARLIEGPEELFAVLREVLSRPGDFRTEPRVPRPEIAARALRAALETPPPPRRLASTGRRCLHVAGDVLVTRRRRSGS